ncbi:hypothetical protein J1614_005924 [Plenodomus biglobosus]|nr:hypothetical protein J1614_005924 [Plenodomus biglobosus]
MGIYQSQGYVPQWGTRGEKQGQQEQSIQSQKQEQAPRQSMVDMANHPVSTSTPALRERADSLLCQQSRASQEQDLRQALSYDEHRGSSHFDDDGHESHEYQVRSSSSEHYHASPLPGSEPQGQLSGLSASFNSPTQVELERQKDHGKSHKSMGKLKGVIKGWVRT